jgi:hypothetical protein
MRGNHRALSIRNCAEISCAKQAQDFSSVARRQIAGILCVFQDLTTKLQTKKTSLIAQVISEQFLSKKTDNGGQGHEAAAGISAFHRHQKGHTLG